MATALGWNTFQLFYNRIRGDTSLFGFQYLKGVRYLRSYCPSEGGAAGYTHGALLRATAARVCTRRAWVGIAGVGAVAAARQHMRGSRLSGHGSRSKVRSAEVSSAARMLPLPCNCVAKSGMAEGARLDKQVGFHAAHQQHAASATDVGAAPPQRYQQWSAGRP
jgi:hypothetical protein